ncbi:MAG TPA: hypothetical protein VLJ37_02170 [bacterium]|nr:hypothetical protein [bacterium]
MRKIALLFVWLTLSAGAFSGCVQPRGPFAGQKEIPSEQTSTDESWDDPAQSLTPKGTAPQENTEVPTPKTGVAQRSLWEDFSGSTGDTRTDPRTIERAFESAFEDKTAPVEEPRPVVAAGPGPIEPKTDMTGADDLNSKFLYRAFYGPNLSQEAPREGDPALLFLRRDGTLSLKLFCEKCFKGRTEDCEGDIGWYPCPKDGLGCLTFIPEDYPKTSFTQFSAKVRATEDGRTIPNLAFEDLKVGRGKLILDTCNILLGPTLGLFTVTDAPDFRVLKGYVPPPYPIKAPEGVRNPEVLRQILQSAPEEQ